MKKIIIYSYLRCSTCQNASKWRDKQKFEYQLIYIVKEPPLSKYLTLALEQYSMDKKKIFNTRGKAFRSITINIDSLSKEEIIELLLSDGKLIKRPFLIMKKKK